MYARHRAVVKLYSWGSNLTKMTPWMARPSVVTCQIARASDVEVVAAYELAEAIGETEALTEITRLGIIIGAMLPGSYARKEGQWVSRESCAFRGWSCRMVMGG